jgi:hypothetical protein
MKNKLEEEATPWYREYTVQRKAREPLVRFMLDALEECGCRVIRHSPPTIAPFRISFESPDGERQGIVAYAFLANRKETRNRPRDEYRFQLKYGPKIAGEHEIWQDPYGLYTTLLLGISPEEGFFVGYDPVLHNPTKHFISLEFKFDAVKDILRSGWTQWEREHRSSEGYDEPIEIVVGGRPASFLRYVRFEREAVGEDQGHRGLLAERPAAISPLVVDARGTDDPSPYIHELSRELMLTADEVLDLIASARRLKMAVRGWVAEVHLERQLSRVDGVSECHRIDTEGAADIELRYEGRGPLLVECKNVLHKPTKEGLPRIDFWRTRSSISDPCSRYYGPDDFDVVAACLHARTQVWEYRFALAAGLDRNTKCPEKLSNKVVVNGRWNSDIRGILGEAARRHR